MINKSFLVIPLFIYFTITSALADDFRAGLLQAADSKTSGAYVRTRFLALMKKPFDEQSNKKKALIIGDSHAQDFLNAVEESHAMSRYQIRTRYIPGQCQIAFAEDSSPYIAAKDQSLCARSDNLAAMQAQIAESDVVILVGNWREWSARLITETVKKLGLRKDQKLAVIGRKSFGKINVRSYLRLNASDLRSLTNPVDAPQVKINNLMKKALDSDVFVDTHTLVCKEDDTCPLFTHDLKLISFDGGHLTPEGARYVGKILFSSPVLAPIR